jgi:hypothetical protein
MAMIPSKSPDVDEDTRPGRYCVALYLAISHGEVGHKKQAGAWSLRVSLTMAFR